MQHTTERDGGRSQAQAADYSTKSRANVENLDPLHDIRDYAMEFVRQKPGQAAMVCVGIGFILGWKLKPW